MTEPNSDGGRRKLAPSKEIKDRLLKRVTQSESGCWIWGGPVTNSGYGTLPITRGGKRVNRLAHRLSYEIFRGPIPEGLQIDHLCRERICINPEHLEPVTARENILRSPIAIAARWAARTHCEVGHEFTPENTRVRVRRGRPSRICATCRRNRDRARREAVTA
jgi:hypothetical protein